MRVVRVHGGTVYHLVHETKTGSRKATAFTICDPDEFQDVSEMRAGVPTCAKCIGLDNPLALHTHEKQIIQQLAFGNSAFSRERAFYRLIKLDIITEDRKLTSRGQILARDYTEGTAPWFGGGVVSHYREPLGWNTRCGTITSGSMPAEFARMTIERYDKMRRAGGVVTCLPCLGLAR